jgi:hypothetical protein
LATGWCWFLFPEFLVFLAVSPGFSINECLLLATIYRREFHLKSSSMIAINLSWFQPLKERISSWIFLHNSCQSFMISSLFRADEPGLKNWLDAGHRPLFAWFVEIKSWLKTCFLAFGW